MTVKAEAQNWPTHRDEGTLNGAAISYHSLQVSEIYVEERAGGL